MKHEYMLLEDDFSGQLSKRISEYLAQGWDLWGNPFGFEAEFDADIRTPHFCQALVRLVESPLTLATQVAKVADDGLTPSQFKSPLADPPGFTVGVPETPSFIHSGPTAPATSWIPSEPTAFCTCEKEGDNPDCRLHHDLGDEPIPNLVF